MSAALQIIQVKLVLIFYATGKEEQQYSMLKQKEPYSGDLDQDLCDVSNKVTVRKE